MDIADDMESYIRFIFIVLMVSKSYCDECFTYNFEDGLDEIFTPETSFICEIWRISDTWTKHNYSSLGLESPHPSSTTFISPSSDMNLASCVTAFPFAARKGILELKVYTKGSPPIYYYLQTVVIDKGGAGIIAIDDFPDLMEGWHNLRLPILNDVEKIIYVTFLGRQDSILLIDSFRYIPSTMNEEDCVVYDSKYTTPSISTVVSTTEMDTINGTDFDENSVTELSTKSPSYFERCVKFNFENHFDSTFSSGSGFCTGANPWTLSNFTLLEINCFHPLSTSFIAPTSTFSCITSPNFLMSDGTLEFNVYMGNVSRSNFPLFWMIKILVQVKSHDGTDNTIATTSYNSHSVNFVPGWNTLKINVENLWQEGHIVLMGMKTEGSIVFIDSFRFIPSTMNDDMCTLYKNQITTPSLTTDDSESTKFTVTEAWKTESTNSGHETTENNQETNEQQTDATVSESFTRSTDFYDQETKTTVRDQWVTTAETITDSTVTESWITKTTNINNQESTMAGIWTLDPTSSTDTETESTDLNEDAATVTTVKEMWTTTSKPNSTECIKYDFEKDFDKLFSSRSGNCRGMTPWTLNNLTSVELESNLHPSSRLCISPKTSLSCVTSFSFLMGSGTLEFNVYIGDSQFSNAINILVMESSEGGFDSYFRNYMYTPMSPNFVLGWNVLRITLDSPRDFEGYIVLQGALAELNSVVLVDSFRYIPSTIHEELCKIYQGQ